MDSLLVKLACMTRIVPMASLAKVTKMTTVMTRAPVQRWMIKIPLEKMPVNFACKTQSVLMALSAFMTR